MIEEEKICYKFNQGLYSTLVKACENVGMAGFRPYMWNGCEQRRGNIGREKLSLVCANDMTILGKSEICT